MWHKREMSQLDAALTDVPLNFTFDLEFSRLNCISGMGGLSDMEQKEQKSIGYNTSCVTSGRRVLLGAGAT